MRVQLNKSTRSINIQRSVLTLRTPRRTKLQICRGFFSIILSFSNKTRICVGTLTPKTTMPKIAHYARYEEFARPISTYRIERGRTWKRSTRLESLAKFEICIDCGIGRLSCLFIFVRDVEFSDVSMNYLRQGDAKLKCERNSI